MRILILAAALLTLAACGQGTPGPQGAKGDKGDKGEPGPAMRVVEQLDCGSTCRIGCASDETMLSAYCFGRPGGSVSGSP